MPFQPITPAQKEAWLQMTGSAPLGHNVGPTIGEPGQGRITGLMPVWDMKDADVSAQEEPDLTPEQAAAEAERLSGLYGSLDGSDDGPDLTPEQIQQYADQLATSEPGGYTDPSQQIPDVMGAQEIATVPDPKAGAAPSFWALGQTNFVDDPRTQALIYGKERFPDKSQSEILSMYALSPKGEMMYKENENEPWKYETPESFLPRAKRFITRLADPSIALGMGMALAGPAGWSGLALGALGAGGGEGIRQATGAALWGDPSNVGVEGAAKGLAKIGGASALDVLGVGAARGVGRGINAGKRFLSSSESRALDKALGPDAVNLQNPVVRAQMAGTEADFRAVGMEPSASETYPGTSLVDSLKQVAREPGPANITVSNFLEQRKAEINGVMGRMMDDILPVAPGGERAALLRGRQGAKTVLERLEEEQSTLAKQLYADAYAAQGPVDLTPVQKAINDMRKTAVGDTQNNALDEIEQAIYREMEIQVPVAGNVRAMAGQPTPTVTRKVKKKISDVESVHNLRKLLDARIRWGNDPASSYDAAIKKNLKALRGMVDDVLKKNPLFREADEAFAEKQIPIDEFTESVLSKMIKVGDDYISKAPGLLFEADPPAIKKALAAIRAIDPEAADSLVRMQIQNLVESTMSSIEGEATARRMLSKVWRDPKQVAKWRAALTPDQFTRVETFMRVLDRVARIVDLNSDTAFKQAKQTALRAGAGGRAGQALMGVTRDGLRNMIIDRRLPEHAERLARALTSPTSGPALRRISRLDPATQQGMDALGAFLTLADQGAYEIGPVEWQPRRKSGSGMTFKVIPNGGY